MLPLCDGSLSLIFDLTVTKGEPQSDFLDPYLASFPHQRTETNEGNYCGKSKRHTQFSLTYSEAPSKVHAVF